MERQHERDLEILTAIDEGEPLTQRALAQRLGVALGLANLAIRDGRLEDARVALHTCEAARPDDPARLREISNALDMPRSSAHALLRTLVAQGWVRSDPTGTMYAIGVRALLVGTSYLDSDPYLPLITPFLEDLRS